LPGIRETRREGIKQTLSQNGIRLFLKQGFEQTTIEQIAESAGISRRTFFRHFATKEDLVFLWYEELGQEIVAVCAGRPAQEAPYDSACAALRSLLKYYDRDAVWAASMMKLSAETPGLLGKSLEKRSLWEIWLAEVLVPKFPGPDAALHARLTTSAAVNCFAQAVAYWFEGDQTRPLKETVDGAFLFASKLDRATPALLTEKP
jgi:AcrR family transcriptional regulator